MNVKEVIMKFLNVIKYNVIEVKFDIRFKKKLNYLFEYLYIYLLKVFLLELKKELINYIFFIIVLWLFYLIIKFFF